MNAIIIKDRFPIPIVDELPKLHGTTIFSMFALRASYHQITPVDVHKTAFRTVDGHFKFLVMPVGLTNAPSIFHVVVNASSVHTSGILYWSFSTISHIQPLLGFLFAASEDRFAAGVSANPTKWRLITEWPPPQCSQHCASSSG
ncbi:hypothetical protein Salat_1664200 [Sesamum alatum]|uniref:Uncharacterized protein n=1 Tax=Sesamum alatum TaxID=300844 RepID=A0AAE1Y6N9_9LAMI|nr:hypothetical protein Salat_1664200 [Sesamum alatum]